MKLNEWSEREDAQRDIKVSDYCTQGIIDTISGPVWYQERDVDTLRGYCETLLEALGDTLDTHDCPRCDRAINKLVGISERIKEIAANVIEESDSREEVHDDLLDLDNNELDDVLDILEGDQ